MEGNNSTRKCGQIGEGDNDEVTLRDFLNEEARLKADADAVLGGSDSNNCTYPQGYLKRQALYACATCSPDGLAGVCLACSYACHEGHDLYELYTKRNFRCDCGNERFGGAVCKLYADKTEPNSRNRYSQNFRGDYCSCNRPYPDPDDPVEDEMIQCVVCEDWHHGRHLNTALPEKDFSEMICPSCMNKHSFLWAYQALSEETVKLSPKAENCDNIDVEKTDCSDTVVKSELPKTQSALVQPGQNSLTTASTSDDTSQTVASSGVKEEVKEEVKHTPEQPSAGVSCKRKREDSEADTTQKILKTEIKTENGVSHNNTSETVISGTEFCLLKALLCRSADQQEKATFWSEGWRQKLCRCEDCMDMYKDKGVEFLLDDDDTVQAYEDRGRNSGATDSGGEEETEAAALNQAVAGMDRVQQIEVVRGFVDMKTQLTQFLEGFAEEGKVVTESDIREFFQGMQQRRRRGQFGMPQPHCR